MIKIKVENKEVMALFAQARQRSGNLQPLMDNIGQLVRRSVIKNFDAGGRPTPWKKSKRGGRDGGKATLTDTGSLKGSIISRAIAARAEIGTNVEYAAYHQFGTRPYIIRARNKKALFFPGARHPVKAVHHPGLPARPFLMVQPEDWKIIKQMVEDFITGDTSA